MTFRSLKTAALSLAAILAATAAFAHAQLQHATPPVGGTVSAAPQQLRLQYSEGVEPRFSTVALATDAGRAIPLGAPAVDPADAKILTVSIGEALKPGVYVVTWRAVSVDTHKTQGEYRFTVAP